MTDDVEETLASLEQRLRALQAELDAEGEIEAAPLEPAALGPPPLDVPRFPRAPGTPPAPPSGEGDPLDRFGVELRRLVTLWDRTAAELRGGGADATLFHGGVALEARGDLPGLCALDRALRGVPGVSSVTLRAYAGGAAALEVALEGEVALVAELRRSLAFDLLSVDGARISLALR